MKTEPCPFCGIDDVKETNDAEEMVCYSECMNCGARGPEVHYVYAKGDSIAAWNIRKHSLAVEFSELKKNADEAKIRLYGGLWLLVEDEVISEGKARELGNMPLHKMIDQCLEYRARIGNEHK